MKTITYFLAFCFIVLLSACSKDSATNYNPNTTGTSGSLSKFTIVGNNLFCIDGNSLKTFSLTNSTSPLLVSTITLNTIPETIFSYENYLLLGTPTGMLIYSAAPTPNFISTYEHILSCDPVVADSGYAYVTLRAINQCSLNTGVNRLEVISIENITSPTQIAQVSLTGPYGLGIDGNNLFVTDNDSTVLVFDVTSKTSPAQISSIPISGARDVIPLSGLLMVMSGKKLSQYNYSDINNIQLISKIDL
jgi:hypothetical protein